jgi:hypothetical protein
MQQPTTGGENAEWVCSQTDGRRFVQAFRKSKCQDDGNDAEAIAIAVRQPPVLSQSKRSPASARLAPVREGWKEERTALINRRGLRWFGYRSPAAAAFQRIKTSLQEALPQFRRC